MAKVYITKAGALGRQLEVATYLLLRGFPAEPIHTLIGACRGLLYGLHQNYPNSFLSNWESKIGSKIVPGKEREWKYHQNRAANFLKHADRDPEEVLSDVDLDGLNELELLLLILAYWSITQPLSHALAIGLFYCGLRNESWFDLSGVVKGAGLAADQLEEYRLMPELTRKDLMLKAFELSIERSGFTV
jgi:hypothetical protein